MIWAFLLGIGVGAIMATIGWAAIAMAAAWARDVNESERPGAEKGGFWW